MPSDLESAEPATPPRDAIVFDVDGTLCDVRAIRGYVVGPGGHGDDARRFDLFHLESLNCPAHPDVQSLAHRARSAGLAIVVVTGRESRWSFVTSLWLQEHSIDYDALYMRPHKDYRPDAEIKGEIGRMILADFRPLLAVDDRDDIIEVWQSAGIPTIRVDANGALDSVEAPSSVTIDPRIDSLSKR